MTAYAVEICQVSKRFSRHIDRRGSLRERLVRGKPTRLTDFWAIRNLSLAVPKGSLYGLIGHNGSGKSTLLKMVGGIYLPTRGSIDVRGRLAALIEVGAGFHPEMTGRENVILNGAILGLSKKEVSKQIESIIDFSGLKDFIDEPVKHYSSGMYVRLGFAVAVHMQPDVLLVDEVLAVGDEEFQRKCLDFLSSLRRRGCTIVLVSHSLAQVESLCDEAAWLEGGELREFGDPSSVVSSYLKSVNDREMSETPPVSSSRALDYREKASISVTAAQLITEAGTPAKFAKTGETICVRLAVEAQTPVMGPNVRLAFQSESGPLVSMVSNHRNNCDLGIVHGTQQIDVALINTPLLPGRYRVHIDVFDGTGSRLLDTWNDAIEFAVRSDGNEIGQGFFVLPSQFRIETIQ